MTFLFSLALLIGQPCLSKSRPLQATVRTVSTLFCRSEIPKLKSLRSIRTRPRRMLVHQFAADTPLQRQSFCAQNPSIISLESFAMLKRQKSVETIRAVACNGRDFDRQGWPISRANEKRKVMSVRVCHMKTICHALRTASMVLAFPIVPAVRQ